MNQEESKLVESNDRISSPGRRGFKNFRQSFLFINRYRKRTHDLINKYQVLPLNDIKGRCICNFIS